MSDRVDAVAQEIRALGRRNLSMPADAAEVESMERLRDACLKELGGIHIMVYAAGVTRRVHRGLQHGCRGMGSGSSTPT